MTTTKTSRKSLPMEPPVVICKNYVSDEWKFNDICYTKYKHCNDNVVASTVRKWVVVL